ncbi:MAG: DUF2271 domain-containing protein [Actinobacteria bacterium]|uniref:Unannotated protein n=1 Tax=freshwater metagenome TaxID=449393 RepID=A0A6J7ATI3_9ZZZZ|nr:DUF2271 domain-containing protein [Actinomycetota bacterium]
MPSDESRFELVSRRAMLKRSLIVGSLVAIPGLACSPSDKEIFAKSTAAPGTSTSTPAATSSTTPAARTTSTAATRPTSPSTTTAPTTGPLLAASSQLAIAFAFAPAASGGRINNPFIAVWVEDASGALVRTVSLWYKSSESKYLNELRRWYAAERASIARGGTDTTRTISGATRVAGSYSVVWDAKNDSGALVPQGDYFVCIEAARERGPYELIRDSLSLGTKALQKKLTDSGELTGASASFGG